MRFAKAIGISTLLLLCSFAGCLGGNDSDEQPPEPLRLNHLQMKGTHNSYHLKPLGGELIDEYNYSHAPLDEQASIYGVRQFEIDVWWIPGLGLRVYHNPYDSASTCDAFTECLEVLHDWSVSSPQHVPIWLMIEPKDPPALVDSMEILQMIEDDIASVWPANMTITPDDVRGDSASLLEAVTEGDGWPLLEESRGKALFVLLDKSEIRDSYVEDNPGLANATMFAIVDEIEPEAAVISWTDPMDKGDVLTAAAEAGFIVRTRPDSGTAEARESNYSRFDLALTSGAHMLSTDYEGVDEDIDYAIWLPEGPVRCNPVTAPPGCTLERIEDVGDYSPPPPS
jgi:hypothetical protein